MTIIQATTPTIKYTFKVVNVSDITTAYLTIKQNGRKIIEKDLSEATVGQKDLSWSFTQTETLQISQGHVTAMLNWKTSDGTRGASAKSSIVIDDNYKNEVI